MEAKWISCSGLSRLWGQERCPSSVSGVSKKVGFYFYFFLPHFSLKNLRAEGNLKSLIRFLLEHALRGHAGNVDVDAG